MAATPTTSSSSSSFSIPNTAAVGGLTVTQPAQTATSYYKIAQGESVTFAWSFDSYLLVQPTSLTVEAIGGNGYTYPVGPTDGVIPGTATSVVWDPYQYNQQNPGLPLAPTTYTLAIFDERGLGAVRKGGVFNPNTALNFALYAPQPYTAIGSGWTCSGCDNGAVATPLSGAFVTVMATILCLFLSGFMFLRTAINRREAVA